MPNMMIKSIVYLAYALLFTGKGFQSAAAEVLTSDVIGGTSDSFYEGKLFTLTSALRPWFSIYHVLSGAFATTSHTDVCLSYPFPSICVYSLSTDILSDFRSYSAPDQGTHVV